MRSKLLASDGQRTHVLVLDPGEEAVSALLDFARTQRLGASQLTAIGAFSQVVLGYFDLHTRQYLEIPVDEQVEVLSLVGDVTEEAAGEDPHLHAHVVLGLRDGTTRGGHLMRGTVAPTLEVMIVESPEHLRRCHDPETGLDLIAP